MKKSIFTFVLFSCCAFAFSQKSGDIKISVTDYQNAKTLKDLVKEIPADCKIVTCEVFAVTKGILVSTTVTDEKISWNRDEVKKGDKIIIDGIKSTCPKKIKSKYKIVLE